MGITDYNKKKQLNVDSVSGTPQVDKAQPLILSGEDAFDVATASFTDSFDVSGQDTDPRGVAFSGSGDKMFVIGNDADNVYEYSLSTSFDVSTASFTDSFDVSGQDTIPNGVAFSGSGDKMFVLGDNNLNVYEYSLSTSFDVSTASFNNSFDVSGQDTNLTELAFSSSGDKMFVLGIENDNVYEYNLSSSFDVSTASFTDSFDVSAQDIFATGFAFSSSGDKMFVSGTDNDNVYEYSLSTSFDVSTASFTDSFDVSGQDTIPSGVAFSGSGDKMFVSGTDNDNVYEYSLGTDDSKTGNGDIVIDFTNVSDAQDIAVYDQNGNLLDYEIESLDTANETGVIWAYNDWVRDGTTQAQLAYGSNSANTDRQNVTATWGNPGQNALQVIHDPSTAVDSTSNNNDGTVNGVSSTDGDLGNAGSFDGTDDKVNIGNAQDISSNPTTLVAYTKTDTLSSDSTIFGRWTDQIVWFYNADNDNIRVVYNDPLTNNIALDQSAGGASSDTFFQNVFTFDGSSAAEHFIDGNSIATASDEMRSNSEDYFLGDDTTGRLMDGVFDDFRFYNEVKPDDWIQADFDASPKAGQVFFSQQSAESTSTAVSATVTDSLGFNENTASTLSFTASDNLQVTESTAGTLSDALSDNVQFSEQVLGTVQDDLTDQLGFTEKTATALASQVSDQLGFTEQTISNLTLQVLTSDNIQFTEQAEAQLLDTVTDQLSFQSTTQSAIAQSTSDQVTYSEAVSSALIDTLTDQVDFTEATSIEGTALLTLTDQVAFAENTKSTLQDLESDQLGFSEDVESRLEQVLEDGLGFSEQFEAELADTLSDSLDFSDRVAETVAATLTDSLSFAEKITASELLDLEIKSPTKAVMTTPDRFAVMESITFKQNDLGDTLKATLKDDNGDINVSNASDVRLIANDRGGKNVLNESVIVTDGSAGEVEYSWSTGDFIEDAGIYRIEFEIEDGTGEVETVPNDGFVTVEIEEELAE